MAAPASNDVTAGAPHFPWRPAPAVASLLLLLLAVDAPERLESVLEILIGI